MDEAAFSYAATPNWFLIGLWKNITQSMHLIIRETDEIETYSMLFLAPYRMLFDETNIMFYNRDIISQKLHRL